MLVDIGYKSYPCKWRKGGTVNQRSAIRTCDKCGKVDDIKWHQALRYRVNTNRGEVDLCSSCARENRILPKGKNHKKWKHGLTKSGYSRITAPDGRRMLLHRFIMEGKLGRKLKEQESVHHIDCDKSNNNIENLYLFESKSHHRICHCSMETVGFSLLGKQLWFNWESKRYTLTKCEIRDEGNIIEPPFKLYTKKDSRWNCGKYYFYYEDKEWKRYHVWVVEQTIGRRLFIGEHVHHVNGITLDNNPSNLCVLESSEHQLCHHSLQQCVAQLYRNGFVKFENGEYRL